MTGLPGGLDQPCMRSWAPRTCKGWDQRSPIDHTCMVARAFPHTCVCSRCGHARVSLPGRWLVAGTELHAPYVRPATLEHGGAVGS